MNGAGLLERLERLEDKYRTLAALRARREEAEAAGRTEFAAEEAAARLEVFRRVAEEFPGALRELEATGAAALRRKAEAVAAEIEEARRDPKRDRPARAWIAVVLDHHAALREAIAAKRWLARRLPRGAPVTGAVVEAFEEWHRRWPHVCGALGPPGRDLLDRIRRPPRGRIQDLVWRALEARHGRARRELEALVYGEAGD